MNRREMLKTAGVLAAGSTAANAVAQNSSGTAQPARKLKIVITWGAIQAIPNTAAAALSHGLRRLAMKSRCST